MSDLSNKKPNISGTYPNNVQTVGGKGAAGFTRVEPYITTKRLKDRWLFGIPLKHPITHQMLSDDTLKEIIDNASARVELECNIDVFPVTRTYKDMWDKTKWDQGWGQMSLGKRNVKELHEISIRTSSSYSVQNGVSSPYGSPADAQNEGVVLYTFTLDWVNMSLARKGILDFVPLQSALNGTIPGGSYGGAAAALFSVFTKMQYVPGFWYVRYTSGFDENAIPSVVNDLIGTYAAMEVLSMLAPLNKYNSQSIGLDGASQSISGPGNQIYALRYQDLEKKAEQLKDMIKAYFSVKIYMSNI